VVSEQQREEVETLRAQTEIELREQLADLKYLEEYVTPENRAWQQSRIEHAEAGLLLARERLEQTRIVAPCDGTILRIIKREGEGVAIAEPDAVLMFGDLSAMRVRAEIDERFVQDLTPGQTALIHGRNLSGKTYRGTIVHREQVMGDKTIFTRASSERKDLDVVQIVIDMEPAFSAPSGLRVDVTILKERDGPVDGGIARPMALPQASPDG
jgi:HlyD family secretion protein